MGTVSYSTQVMIPSDGKAFSAPCGLLTLLNTKIVSSALLTFAVGPGRKEFTIHFALVAAQSRSLGRLVNGHMLEASECRVEWSGTDETTFVHFSQFAYTGDYNGPEWYTNALPKYEQQAAADDDGGWETPGPTPEKNGESPKLAVADEPYSVAAPLLPRWFTEQCPGGFCNHDAVSWIDGFDVFIVHAQVYLFADYHGIAPLQTLALCKLHRILVHFLLNHDSIGRIVWLVRYIYDNTPPDPKDRLRSMVSLYAACTFFQFKDNKDVDLLMRTVGDFVGDVFQQTIA
ncbi:hypothetical protein SPBR_04392 [Sporothrix brasiliensis 5110]|uniref:BTB domain-containing protein n=1 Tax=Sporothrix brasiliensis 5110 TaxID=1398154 RepID=A0A0C2F3W3_9PEZI|nr:uncharacterized protein SPBR_04392 [Sporothrix brasiliensis 5110]KIH93604.1 hypothetical protein SPBR_04392 [Sporothrix brasiliensis 5110]